MEEEEGPCFLQEPEFPARVLLGVPFGLAFGGGGEGLLWVRQWGEGTVLRGAQPLHQGLQLVLLLLEVQLHTASKKHREWGQTVARPSPLAALRFFL